MLGRGMGLKGRLNIRGLMLWRVLGTENAGISTVARLEIQ